MTYRDALRYSNKLFGSFFSLSRNIWFRKYRREQRDVFRYDSRKVVVLFSVIYTLLNVVFVAYLTIIIIVADISFGLPSYAMPHWLSLTIVVCALMIPAIVVNYFVFWPFMYWLLVKAGLVKRIRA